MNYLLQQEFSYPHCETRILVKQKYSDSIDIFLFFVDGDIEQHHAINVNTDSVLIMNTQPMNKTSLYYLELLFGIAKELQDFLNQSHEIRRFLSWDDIFGDEPIEKEDDLSNMYEDLKVFFLTKVNNLSLIQKR